MNFTELFRDNVQWVNESNNSFQYVAFVKLNCAIAIQTVDSINLNENESTLKINFTTTKDKAYEEVMCDCVNKIYFSSKIKLSNFNIYLNGQRVTGNKFGIDYFYSQAKNENDNIYIDKLIYVSNSLIFYEELYDSSGKLIQLNEYHQHFGLLKKTIKIFEDHIFIDLDLLEK
jgi:hypothetical protein